MHLRPQSTVRLALACITALTSLSGGLGCSSEPPPSPERRDEITAIPFPSTYELDAAALASLDESAEDGTLRFDVAPGALDGVQVGNILVAGVGPKTPAGLLRAVLTVEREGESLTLRTAHAPIQLAYRKLSLRVSRSTAVAEPEAGAQLLSHTPFGGSFNQTIPFDYVLFDADGDVQTTNDQVAIDGEIGGGFNYDLSLDVDWGDIFELPTVITRCLESLVDFILSGELPNCSLESFLPEAKVTFAAEPMIHAHADVHGAAILDYEKTVDLASKTLTPIIIPPVVILPIVDLTAELEGGASSAFSTGLHGSAVFETSVTVSSKTTGQPQYSPPELKDTDFGPNDTSVTLHAHAKVGVGARLNLMLFGMTGPYATARAYGAIDADVLQTPCWSLRAGIDMDLGVKAMIPVPLPAFDPATLIDWRAPTVSPLDLEIASGACDAPPDAPTLPPGSGADETRYAMPNFTPWSRTFTPPVEGSLARSPGNSVTFADFHRTIDGNYVRAGYGVTALTKFDGEGNLIWAREYEFQGERLRPRRVHATKDAALMVASSAVQASVVLTKIAQDGSVLDARGYDVPLSTCNVDVTSLAPDGAGGFYVVGRCVGGGSYLLHAGESDTTFRLLDVADTNTFAVRLAARIGDGAFLSGWLNDGRDALFAVHIAPDGTPVYAKRYQGCAEAWDAIPSAAIVGDNGEVTLAGSGGAQHNGMVLRLRPDGSVGFASFPGFGFGAGSVFLLDSIAELPTTGYVAGGSSVRFTGVAPDNVPSAALVGLDAGGRILWANRYTFGPATDFAASGHVGVRLTDDGGVVATALVADNDDPLGGRLWAFKAFAKDGAIPFADDAVTTTPLGVTNLECFFTATDLDVAFEAVDVSPRSVEVSVEDSALTIDRQ